jgi:hypothetical protein
VNSWEQDIELLRVISRLPGCTALDLARWTRGKNEDLYDAHRRVSWGIARLRIAGLVSDVTDRCPYCGSARSRWERNVPLFALRPIEPPDQGQFDF